MFARQFYDIRQRKSSNARSHTQIITFIMFIHNKINIKVLIYSKHLCERKMLVFYDGCLEILYKFLSVFVFVCIFFKIIIRRGCNASTILWYPFFICEIVCFFHFTYRYARYGKQKNRKVCVCVCVSALLLIHWKLKFMNIK